MLFELFYLGMVNPPDTLLCDIFSIPSTKYVCFSGNLELKKFIKPSPEQVILDEEHLYNKLKETISPIAGQSHIGIMCSGGLDSSLLTALIREQSDSEINLFTLYYDKHHSDVVNTRLLAKMCAANNYYFKQESFDFLSTIYESLWLGESEAVGTLSFNIALELLFSKFVSKDYNSVIVTGDVNSVKTEQSPNVYSYCKKYRLLSNSAYELTLKSKLKSSRNYGYLNFIQKYNTNSDGNNLFFPEVLVLRITGKIRSTMMSPPYYLPFVDQKYLQYIENLMYAMPHFNYRQTLKALAIRRNILPQNILLTPKTWMPGWAENNPFGELILSITNTCNVKDSFCSSLFGEGIGYVIYEACQHKNYRFVMALFYLELFYNNFVRNPEHLLSKDTFMAANLCGVF